MVREKNGGVRGVEALTLPYDNGRLEVACNLLQVGDGDGGDGGGVGDVEKRVELWLEGMIQERQRQEDDGDGEMEVGREYFIEEGYRVGTTVEQCKDVLLLGCVDEEEKDEVEYAMKVHDDLILERLRGYLLE